MTEAELRLVDLRSEIRERLESMECEVEYTVRQSQPREPSQGIIITYQEFDNRSTNCPVVDEVSYQIELWAFQREDLVTLAEAVNRAMLEMGLKRLYMGPESVEPDGYERKIMRFGRLIDKRYMRFIDG